MVVTKATSIGVKRQPTDPRDQISFADELAALPFLAKTQILKRDKNRNREAVVNAGALNIFRSNARLGKGLCAGDDRARRRHIRIAATNMLHELTSPSDPDLGRASDLAISGLTTTRAPPPSVMTQQSSRCKGSATIGELTTSSTVVTFRSNASGL